MVSTDGDHPTMWKACGGGAPSTSGGPSMSVRHLWINITQDHPDFYSLTFFWVDHLSSQTCHPPHHQSAPHHHHHNEMDGSVAVDQSECQDVRGEGTKGWECMHLIRVHLHVIFHGIHMSEPAPRLPCTSALVTKVFMSNTKLQTKYYLEEIFADGDPSIHSRKINSNSFPYHLEFNGDHTF